MTLTQREIGAVIRRAVKTNPEWRHTLVQIYEGIYRDDQATALKKHTHNLIYA